MNLFIASELHWREKGVRIRQETDFHYEEQAKLMGSAGSSRFKLLVRYPGWVKQGALQVTVDGKEFSCADLPSSYISIERKWGKGNVVLITLPMHNSIEHMASAPGYIAFMHGPVLPGAKSGNEDLKGLIAGDGRWGPYAEGAYLPVDKAPIPMEDDLQNIGEKLVPVNGKPLNFKPNARIIIPIDLTLEPFFQIHDARYIMYWLALSNEGYQIYLDSLANIEKAKRALENRSIDYAATGEQQPETDHNLQAECSETPLSLFIRYWGGAYGGRKFDMYTEDEEPQHRHQSHLFGLYPGHQITTEKTPELAEAARKILEIRGDQTTGWSKGWRINLWARLKDGNQTYKMFRELLSNVEPDGARRFAYSGSGGTYPNLLDAHPPFQIDGNFGGAAGVVEMLLQSGEEGIHLLPAIPDAWHSGSVSGLCARGGFEISINWEDGKLTGVDVLSKSGKDCCIHYNDQTATFKTIKGNTYSLDAGLTVR